MKKLSVIILSLVLLFGFTTYSYASTDTLGMGNAPGPAATGDNGLDWNPATIGIDNKFIMEFDLLNASLSTNSFGAYEFLDYMGFTVGSDSVLSQSEVEEMLSKIPNEGFGIDGQAESQFKLIIGPVGIKAGGSGQAVGRLDKDIFQLILKGNKDFVDVDGDNQPDDYLDLTSSKGSLLATGKFGAAFNLPLHNYKFFKKYDRFYEKLYFGTGINYNIGGYYKAAVTEDAKIYFGYSDSSEDDFANPTIRLAESDTDLAKKINNLSQGEVYPIFKVLSPNSPGSGLSLDLGLFARKDKLSYGLSLMDLGSITITDYKLYEYGFTKDESDEITFTDDVDAKIVTDPYKVRLPWSFNTGVEYRWKEWLTVGAQLSRIHIPKGKDEDGEGHFEFGTGAELNPLKVIPFRVGVIASGATNSLIITGGSGLHLGPVKIDLSGRMSQKKLTAGLNTSIEF